MPGGAVFVRSCTMGGAGGAECGLFFFRTGGEPGGVFGGGIQPSPLPFIQRGTSSSTEAVQSTRVSPKVTRHEPIVMVVKSRVKLNGRSSSAWRPS